jgi:non-ribosomal peptide synthetase component F
LPFEKLVEELQPDRLRNRSPLVQVTFQLLDIPESTIQLGELAVERLKSQSERARFDLEMHLRRHSDELRGNVVYNQGLFDDTTISRMVGHFETLLHGVISNPDQPASSLPILTESELRQLLVFGGTER